jgi:hypothetical protein
VLVLPRNAERPLKVAMYRPVVPAGFVMVIEPPARLNDESGDGV